MELSANAQIVIDRYAGETGFHDHWTEELAEYLDSPRMGYSPALAAELREFIRQSGDPDGNEAG